MNPTEVAHVKHNQVYVHTNTALSIVLFHIALFTRASKGASSVDTFLFAVVTAIFTFIDIFIIKSTYISVKANAQ